jgi:hypothetical protein
MGAAFECTTPNPSFQRSWSVIHRSINSSSSRLAGYFFFFLGGRPSGFNAIA